MKAPDLKYAILEKVPRRKSEKQVNEVFCLIWAAARGVEQPLIMPIKQLRVCRLVTGLSLSEPVFGFPTQMRGSSGWDNTDPRLSV